MEEDSSNKSAKDDSSDDNVSAEGAAAQADVMLESAKQQSAKENQSNRNKLLAALLVLILLVVGGFLLFGSSSDTDNEATNENTTNSEAEQNSNQSEAVNQQGADTIVYAHASTESSPRSLFSRPASGGDRISSDFSFSRTQNLLFDTDGNSYAVLTETGELYYGTTAEEPRMLTDGFTVDSSTIEVVNEVHLDQNAGSILVINKTSSDLTAWEVDMKRVDIASGTVSDFYSETAESGKVPFGEAWDGSNGLMYVYRTCSNCGGDPSQLLSIDENGNESEVYSRPTTALFTQYAFNHDKSKALYVDATSYEVGNEFGIAGGIFEPTGAPFTLYELDLASGSATEVVTFGSPEDVGSDGFFSSPVSAWTTSGEGQQRPVYSYQKLLFVQSESGNFDNYFETGQGDILSIYAVDADEVLVGASNNEGETISYFNIESQKGAIVMETLSTTSILGAALN